MRTTFARTFSFALATLAAAAALAGPLNPPAGAVQSSMKTLTEVEPRTAINAINTPGNASAMFRITQPGSYYLTGDVLGAAGKSGIEVAVSNVRIDLNGFTLRGVPDSGNGVVAGGIGAQINIEVVNGTINYWQQSGVNFSTGAYGMIVRNVRSLSNGQHGIVTSYNARIESCTALMNGMDGVQCGSGSVVTECQANENERHGLNLGLRCAADHCVATGNTNHGIATGASCVLTGCVASNNSSDGINFGAGCRASDCVANDNNSYGYFIRQGCTLTDCTGRANATSAVRGTGPSVTVSRCTFEGVAGFPVITVDAASSARVADNVLTGGTYAVSAPSVANALITGNQCVSQSTSAFNLAATAQYGAIVTANGPIGAVSPFANFVR